MARYLEILQWWVCKKRVLTTLLHVVGYRAVNSLQFGGCKLFSVCFLIREQEKKEKKRKEKKRGGAAACHRPRFARLYILCPTSGPSKRGDQANRWFWSSVDQQRKKHNGEI